jgi:hypothetical protein
MKNKENRQTKITRLRLCNCGPLFPLGEVFLSRNAHQCLDYQEVLCALGRHACGDWGVRRAK